MSEPVIFYTREELTLAVNNILEGEPPPHDEKSTKAERLVRLLDVIQHDLYGRGQRKVQQEIITALDLRQLLRQ